MAFARQCLFDILHPRAIRLRQSFKQTIRTDGQPEAGRAWRTGKIRYLLKNEIYIGNLVYSRASIKRKGRRIANPPDRWVRKDNAIEGLVSRELFFKAQEIFAANRQKNCISTADLLASARRLFQQHGRLSSDLIKRLKQTPCAGAFQKRFGSLPNLYRLVGYTPQLGYGQNVLHLTLASAYIRKLLENGNVAGLLKASHADIFGEFEKIAALEAL